MSGLDSNQLALMRSQVTDWMLPDTCVLWEMSYPADGGGGFTPGSAPVFGGTVSCRIDPLKIRTELADVPEALGREVTVAQWQFTTEYDAPLAEDQQIVCAGRTY